MIQELAKNIYTFNVDLPQTALKQINIYVIKDGDRALVFDSGYNLPETKVQLLEGLDQLGLTPEDCDLVLTHLHADHTGLAYVFQEAGSKIYAGSVDGRHMNNMASGTYWEKMSAIYETYGSPDNPMATEANPGYAYRPDQEIEFIPLDPGDLFEFGDYSFQVLDLIGHTPGHIGLYAEDQDFIFSADTVLDPISPNITYWGDDYPNILASYIETLRKLMDLGLDRMFATHRKMIENPNERMGELIHHHHLRLQEILDTMDPGKAYTVEDISSKISWRVRVKDWSDFPPSQKIFANGETMAHLDYLAHSGHVSMENTGGTLYFTKQIDILKEV